MKQKLQDIKNLNGKSVVVRFDYNVPIKDGIIVDSSKIDKSLETLNYLLDRDCKVIILSHLGSIKTEEDKQKNTLEPVAKYLENLLGESILFSKETRSHNLETTIASMELGKVILIENTRHEDLNQKLESKNNPQLASYWAAFGELFVMDAFASAHRAHASTVGITKFIPSCIGFLVQKEKEILDSLLDNPKKPFTLVMGGAKTDDKLELLETLSPKCDNILLAGGLANTCLKSLGFNVASSLVSKNQEVIKRTQDLLLANKNKIILPLDAIVGSTYDENMAEYRLISEIRTDDKISDIGPETIKRFAEIIRASSTIFVNGTQGIVEDKKFANGTKEILQYLKKSNAKIIIGGGDSASAAINFGYGSDFQICTGGGASLQYLANGTLPGIEAIAEERSYEILDS